METQGLPLWAVRESTGQIYAVIGWREVEPRQYAAIGVELTVPLDGPAGTLLSGVAFYSDREAAYQAADNGVMP